MRKNHLTTLPGFAIVSLCLLLLIHAFFLEIREVSTGSMAPALSGRHRSTNCPHCGAPVQVGIHPGATSLARQSRTFARAHCWNCGGGDLGLEACPEQHGDRVLVNKLAYLFCSPRRWEVVVFRLFGFTFIKRIIGLPGETVAIRDGDVWIDGKLYRKTLDEFLALRIPLFDGAHGPDAKALQGRWQFQPAGKHSPPGRELHLDGMRRGQRFQMAIWQPFFSDVEQFAPIRDEYGYNGNQSLSLRDVHDFQLECDVEVDSGDGSLQFCITDGADTVVADIPITSDRRPASGWLLVWPGPTLFPRDEVLTPSSGQAATPARVFFRPGSCYHVQLALVDRRATLRVGGCEAILDLPAVEQRRPVSRPVAVSVRHGAVVVRQVRLFRDVHYTQDGRNGVGGKVVHLAAGQYFVLGDNSPVSEDSRFWPEHGVVAATSLIGRPIRVSWPW
jgi:signal peptidase I